MKEANNREYHDTDIVINNDPGVGIKHGKFTDATGPEFGWRDIIGQVIVRVSGPNRPTWEQIGSSPFRAYQFSVGDISWFVYHVPHDFVPNSEVFFHTHWISDGTNTNSVKWEYTYMYAKGFGQEAFAVAGTTVTAEEAATGTAYTHMVTETAGAQLNITEPDGIIYVRITRVTNGGTDSSDNIFMLTSDIHYQSTGIATKQKAPNFYAD